MNLKKFRDIGNSEPRPWNHSVGTRFEVDEEDADEVPVPYCDEFDDEEEEDTEEEEDVEETETETETESITSVGSKKNPLKRTNKKTTCVVPKCSIVLQEEFDFMPE